MDEAEFKIKVAKTILDKLSIPLDETKLLKYAKGDHIKEVKELLWQILVKHIDPITSNEILTEFINKYSETFLKGIK